MTKKSEFKDLVIINNTSFKDKRGYFKELLREKKLKKRFPFLVMSFSKKNVIRGLHLQKKNSQGKFISVIKGKIFDVAVDLRKNSKTYGHHFSIELTGDNHKMLWVPHGFAHGFSTLEDDTVFCYKCTNPYHKQSEGCILWNDPDLNIDWKIDNPIISNKDKEGIELKNFNNNIFTN